MFKRCNLIIYYMQFYLSQDLFLSFINSTISYKSENFLLIHGTGIGIHGMIDLYQNYLHSLTNINMFEPSSIFSFLIHISFSSIIFFTSFVLFKRNNLNNKNIKLLISFFMIIFLCCFPRISPYDFFLIIPSIYEDYFASPNDFAIIFSFRIIPNEKIVHNS